MANLGNSKIKELLSLQAEDEIQRHFKGMVKDTPLLERLAKLIQEHSFNWDKAPVTFFECMF